MKKRVINAIMLWKLKGKRTHQRPVDRVNVQVPQLRLAAVLDFLLEHAFPRVQFDDFHSGEEFADSSQAIVGAQL